MEDKFVFKLGELFCEPGGIACGAMKAKSSDGRLSIEHAWVNDYDLDTCETYIKRISPDNENCPIFKVITRDFGSFHMRMAQQGFT